MMEPFSLPVMGSTTLPALGPVILAVLATALVNSASGRHSLSVLLTLEDVCVLISLSLASPPSSPVHSPIATSVVHVGTS